LEESEFYVCVVVCVILVRVEVDDCVTVCVDVGSCVGICQLIFVWCYVVRVLVLLGEVIGVF